MIVFQAHKKSVESLAFSPDNVRLATAGKLECVRLWQAPFDVPQQQIAGEDLYYPQLAFSPDGRLLACASRGALVWSLAESRLVITEGIGSITRCGFSPDGGTFAVQAHYDVLRRWRTADWRELPPNWGRAKNRAEDAISPLAYSPRGGLMALAYNVVLEPGQWACDVVLHEPDSGERRGKVRVSQSHPKLAFSPDGRILAALVNTQLRVWSVPGCEELAVRKGGRKHFQDLAFTLDGNRLVTVSNDETVRVWDTATWTEVGAYQWNVGKLACVAVSPDGMRMAAGSSTGRVVVWDVD